MKQIPNLKIDKDYVYLGEVVKVARYHRVSPYTQRKFIVLLSLSFILGFILGRML